jgi:ABC-type spermidine/putrescine transport system permease subunit II
MDLGCRPLEAWFKVTLPALAPAIASGAILAFTLSFDDFVITYFTTGPGDGTLPVKIFSMVRHGISPKVHALATLILAGSVVLVVLARSIAGPTKEIRT